MIQIGKFQELFIARDTDFGLFLEDEGGEEVLLPNKYCPETYRIGDRIQVFVYRDHEERKTATTLTPKIKLNEFALLKVTDVNDFGAFLDWGLEKELLVPHREQRLKMEKDRWYLVYLALDQTTDRLFATTKLDKYLDKTPGDLQEGAEAELLVQKKTDLGYAVIINQRHKGLLFENEVFKELRIGQYCGGYIKKIREDGKIDVSLYPIGFVKANAGHVKLILEKLEANNGFLPLHDRSNPQEISDMLGISKKAFKKAIGALYKQRKVDIEETGIKLVTS